ncbi:hypothetical protein FKM82_009438 [Ascaphus truei]
MCVHQGNSKTAFHGTSYPYTTPTRRSGQSRIISHQAPQVRTITGHHSDEAGPQVGCGEGSNQVPNIKVPQRQVSVHLCHGKLTLRVALGLPSALE